jgi:hypothetical protein
MSKTGGTNVAIPKPRNTNLMKAGDVMVCTKSTSFAYVEGEEYTVYNNEKSWACMRGKDGLEDICSMLLSSFKPATPKVIQPKYLNVV